MCRRSTADGGIQKKQKVERTDRIARAFGGQSGQSVSTARIETEKPAPAHSAGVGVPLARIRRGGVRLSTIVDFFVRSCYNGKVIIENKKMDWICWSIGTLAFFLSEELRRRGINHKIF